MLLPGRFFFTFMLNAMGFGLTEHLKDVFQGWYTGGVYVGPEEGLDLLKLHRQGVLSSHCLYRAFLFLNPDLPHQIQFTLEVL